MAQSRRPVVPTAVVAGSIFRFEIRIIEHERSVHKDVGGRNALRDGGGVYERFETGTRLTSGLQRVIVLIAVEIVAANERTHFAGVRFDRYNRSLNVR